MTFKYTYPYDFFNNNIDAKQIERLIIDSKLFPELKYVRYLNNMVYIIFTTTPSNSKQALDDLLNTYSYNNNFTNNDGLTCIQLSNKFNLGPYQDFDDINFNNIDFSNNQNKLYIDTVNYKKIYIYEDGLYNIDIKFRLITGSIDAQIVKNNTEVIPYTVISTLVDDSLVSNTFLLSLNSGDNINLQLKSTDTNKQGYINNLIVSLIKLEGIIGPPGPQGSKGTPGDGTGNVLGVNSSLDNELVLFGGTNGKNLKNSNIIIQDIADKDYVNSIINNKIWLFKYKKNKGENGGTFLNNIWDKRLINTVFYSSGGDVSLNNDSTINLMEGKYHISVSTITKNVGNNIIRIYNNTSSNVIDYSMCVFSDNVNTLNKFDTIILLDTLSNIELQHMCSFKQENDGYGECSGINDDTFMSVKIIKL